MKTNKFLAAILLATSFALAPSTSWAGVFFDWVCDDPTCNGSTPSFTFSFEIEFANSVVTPNGSFTGVDGPPANVLSAAFSTDLGGGFTLSLDDLINNLSGLFDEDRRDFHVLFDSTANEVKDLLDDGDGSFLAFNTSGTFSGDGNWLYFLEGANQTYSIFSINKAAGASIGVRWLDSIDGKLVRRVPVPEPTTLTIFGLGLAGLGFMRRRKKLN